MTQMFAAWGVILTLMLFLRWRKPIIRHREKVF